MRLSAMVFKSHNFQRFAGKLCADDDISNATLSATVGSDGVIVELAQPRQFVAVCISIKFPHQLITAANHQEKYTVCIGFF